MKIIKVLIVIFFMCIQTISAQIKYNFQNNPTSVNFSDVSINKDICKGSFGLKDSIKNYEGINLIVRLGFSIYDFKNDKGGGPISTEILGGYRFSQSYFLGLGVGLYPIQQTKIDYSGGIILIQGISHFVDSINFHVLKSNYPIIIAQRVNIYGSRKTSYSLNLNTGIILSKSYDHTMIYYDSYYWETITSESRFTPSFYSSIGIGIKRKINRYGAFLLDFETDFISFPESDNLYLNYFAFKIGFEFNTNSLKK
jgi:hypothetical protein